MEKKGFTLVELLAVIAILAILVIIALPNVLQMFNNAKKSTFKTEVLTVYKQAGTDFINDSLKSSGPKYYCDTPRGNKDGSSPADCKNLNLTTTKKYYVEMDSTGKVTYIGVRDNSFVYGRSNVSSINEIETNEVLDASKNPDFDIYNGWVSNINSYEEDDGGESGGSGGESGGTGDSGESGSTSGNPTLTVVPNGGPWSGSASTQVFTQESGTTKIIPTPSSAKYSIGYSANGQGATFTGNPVSVSRPFTNWSLTGGGTMNSDLYTFGSENGRLVANYVASVPIQLPSISKSGATCKWAEGSPSGTRYTGGTTRYITHNTIYYAVCSDSTSTATACMTGMTKVHRNPDFGTGIGYVYKNKNGCTTNFTVVSCSNYEAGKFCKITVTNQCGADNNGIYSSNLSFTGYLYQSCITGQPNACSCAG